MASQLCNCLEKFDPAQTFVCGFVSSCSYCKSSQGKGLSIPRKHKLDKDGEDGHRGTGGCSAWLLWVVSDGERLAQSIGSAKSMGQRQFDDMGKQQIIIGLSGCGGYRDPRHQAWVNED